MDDYNPRDIESKWTEFWDEERCFEHESPADYTIDTPPPTVSGSLHLGHVYQYVIQDIPARFHRQIGDSVFFPFGYDNNGIATERFIEREKGVDRTEVSNDEFSEYYREVVHGKMADYRNKMESLGVSIDWSRTYETIEDSVQETSQLSFIELYEKGREYRDKAPAIWCPECQTAISQAETEALTEDSAYHRIRFSRTDGEDVEIETTRPELLPACVSVFVHPDDERADELVGSTLKVPIFGQEVEVLTDERVDMEEGSGVVMCCTFGDTTDIEWYKSHDLDLRVAIDENGKMTDLAGTYSKQEVDEARENIVQELDENGYLIDSRPIEHDVQVHSRCDTPTEYRVTDQWYIELLDKTDEYLRIADDMNWFPEKMKTRYRNWVEGLEWDWCISRQRDVGIPIPVWYCSECGNEVVADRERLPVDPSHEDPSVESCSECDSTDFTPETDVFDTWATSSLTPLINSEWNGGDSFDSPDRYPMNVRPQGHDIISTWLFYTIVKCYEHTGTPPFNDLLINGHILDENMEKMSASRGNVVEPETVMSEYSMDAIRYWCAGASVGSDIPYKEQNLESAEKLLRKLWNASILISDMTPEVSETVRPSELNSIDKWMLSEIEELAVEVREHYRNYEYEKARRKLRTKFWNVFCDDYLEIAKQREPSASLRYALQQSHKAFLKMFSPIIPFTCEEIWNEMYVNMNFENAPENWENIPSSIHESGWVDVSEPVTPEFRSKGRESLDVISAVRQWKASNGLALNEEVSKVTVFEDLSDFRQEIRAVTHAQEIEFKSPEDMKTVVELNYENVGPKYGGKVKQIEQALESGDFNLDDEGQLNVESETLESEMFEVHKVPTTTTGNSVSGDAPVVVQE